MHISTHPFACPSIRLFSRPKSMDDVAFQFEVVEVLRKCIQGSDVSRNRMICTATFHTHPLLLQAASCPIICRNRVSLTSFIHSFAHAHTILPVTFASCAQHLTHQSSPPPLLRIFPPPDAPSSVLRPPGHRENIYYPCSLPGALWVGMALDRASFHSPII